MHSFSQFVREHFENGKEVQRARGSMNEKVKRIQMENQNASVIPCKLIWEDKNTIL